MGRIAGAFGMVMALGLLAGCAEGGADGAWHKAALEPHKPYAGAIMTSSSLPPPGLPAHDPLDIVVR